MTNYEDDFYLNKIYDAGRVIQPDDTRTYEQIAYAEGLMPEVPGQLPLDLRFSETPEGASQQIDTWRRLARLRALVEGLARPIKDYEIEGE